MPAAQGGGAVRQFAVMPAAQDARIATVGGLQDINPGTFNIVRCACAWAFTNAGTTTELIGLRAVIESRGLFGENQVVDARHLDGVYPDQPAVIRPADGEKENLQQTRNDAIRRRSISWSPMTVLVEPGEPGLITANLDVGIELLAGRNNYDVKLFLQRLKPDGSVTNFKDRRFSDVFDVEADDIFLVEDVGDGPQLTITGIV